MTLDDFKVCAKCNQLKLKTEYHKCNQSKDGLRSRCKSCSHERQRERVGEMSPEQRNLFYKKANKNYPERFRRYKYGVLPKQYADMLNSSNGCCEICGVVFGESRNTLPCIDHDHSTGFVRGLLCRLCNLGIGNLRDEPEILRSALDYLEKNSASKKPTIL